MKKDENLSYIGRAKENEETFLKVYPFATENVSEYFKIMDLKDKSLLTVGSSCDQLFNALVLGVKNITVYDINENVETFYKLKKDLILNNSRRKLYHQVKKIDVVPVTTDIADNKSIIRINNYLQNDENYELLRSRLMSDDNIEFVRGDVFNIGETLGGKKYDRIVLSNILQYLDFFAKPNDPYKFLAEKFPDWDKHLSDDGIMQLLYLYSFNKKDVNENNSSLSSYNLKRVKNAIGNIPLELYGFPGATENTCDAVVTYTKKR